MKIFLSALSFKPEFGGPARSVPQLGDALAKLGVEVGLWANDGSAITSTLIPTTPGLVALGGSAKDAWDRFGSAELLHDNGLWRPHHRTLNRLSLERRVPRIVSTRGMLEPWSLKQKPIKKRIAWLFYQKRDLQACHTLHATADSEANNLRRLGLGARIEIIPNGIDLPAFGPRKIREGNESRPFTCLFMSRLHPKKGIPMLLDAWAQIKPRNWNLVLAGPDEGGYRNELEVQVAKLELEQVVSFAGNLEGEQKSEILREADLFILPTYSENFGIVVAEALAHGCPVITTHGAPWEKIEQSECGWWVSPETSSISKALREAVSLTPAQRQSMGRRGRSMVAQNFTWPQIAEKFVAAYQTVLNHH